MKQIKDLLNNLKRRTELKEDLKKCSDDIRNSKRVIDSINNELDLIREGKLNGMSREEREAYIGTLLQKKIKEEQLIVVAALRMIDIENALKGLF